MLLGLCHDNIVLLKDGKPKASLHQAAKCLAFGVKNHCLLTCCRRFENTTMDAHKWTDSHSVFIVGAKRFSGCCGRHNILASHWAFRAPFLPLCLRGDSLPRGIHIRTIWKGLCHCNCPISFLVGHPLA